MLYNPKLNLFKDTSFFLQCADEKDIKGFFVSFTDDKDTQAFLKSSNAKNYEFEVTPRENSETRTVTVTVTKSALKYVLGFAAPKSDIRPQLKQIVIQEGRLLATDGLIMVELKVPTNCTDSEFKSVKLSRELVELALKVIKSKEITIVVETDTEGSYSVTLKTPKVTVYDPNGHLETTKHPDFDRVLSKPFEGSEDVTEQVQTLLEIYDEVKNKKKRFHHLEVKPKVFAEFNNKTSEVSVIEIYTPKGLISKTKPEIESRKIPFTTVEGMFDMKLLSTSWEKLSNMVVNTNREATDSLITKGTFEQYEVTTLTMPRRS